MKLIEVREDGTGIADLDGARSEVNLSLLDQPKVGNYVIVHAGFAIERLDEKEANERIALFEEMGSIDTKTQSSRSTEIRNLASFASFLCALCVKIFSFSLCIFTSVSICVHLRLISSFHGL